MGADLAMIITPYFVQPSQDELFEHFTAVAKAASLPILLYNNPPRTGVNILPRTLARCMAAAENIVRSEEHTSELQSLMRISYAVFCLKKKNNKPNNKEQ